MGYLLKMSPVIAGRYLVIVLDDAGRIHLDENTMLSSGLEKAVRVVSSAERIHELVQIPDHPLSAQFADKKGAHLFFPGRGDVFDLEDLGYTSDYPTFNLVVLPLMKSIQ